MIDRRPERLNLARQFGAELAIHSEKSDPHSDLSQWAGPSGVDCVIDATGNEDALNLALHLVRRDGHVVAYGTFGKHIPLDVDQVVYKQIELTGAVGSNGCWDQAIQLVELRKVELSPIVTHMVSLSSLADTLADLENGSRQIKIVVQP